MLLRIHRFLPHTISEGPGKRACLWVQGCSIHCDGCAVPWTWSKDAGEIIETEKLYQMIMKSKVENGIEGVTFLGGEPFDQATALVQLARRLSESGLGIMTFSGYTYELITKSNRKDWNELLAVTDLLVDGPFKKEKLDISRPWVGSSNQNFRFLTDRYAYLKERLLEIPNRLEIRLEPTGEIQVNGMVTQVTLNKLLSNLGQRKL